VSLRDNRQREIIAVAAFVVCLEGVVTDGDRSAVRQIANVPLIGFRLVLLITVNAVRRKRSAAPFVKNDLRPEDSNPVGDHLIGGGECRC